MLDLISFFLCSLFLNVTVIEIQIAVYDIPKLAVKIKVAPNPFVANSVFIPV